MVPREKQEKWYKQYFQPPMELTGLEKQRKYILTLAFAKSGCPLCEAKISKLDAADENYEIGNYTGKYTCPECGAGLRDVVPLVAMPQPWFWVLSNETRETLLRMWKDRK